MTNRTPTDTNITANDITLHVRDWGGEGDPIILLHGLASSANIWNFMVPYFDTDTHIIALDQRGHGTSDKPDGDYDYATLVADLIAVMDSLGMESALLIGHSWGAGVGLYAAAHHPDRVRGLVLVDGGLWDIKSRMTWEEAKVQLRPPEFDGIEAAAFRDRIMGFMPGDLARDEIAELMLSHFRIEDGKVYRQLPIEYHMRIVRSMWETSTPDLMKAVTCPVLATIARWPGRDDADRLKAKEKAADQAISLLADGEVIWFDESVHDIPIHYPKKLADTIMVFIKGRLN